MILKRALEGSQWLSVLGCSGESPGTFMCFCYLDSIIADSHLTCFHVFAINSAVLNNPVHIPFLTCFSISTGQTHRSRTAKSKSVCTEVVPVLMGFSDHSELHTQYYYKTQHREFPGSAVVRALSSHY